MCQVPRLPHDQRGTLSLSGLVAGSAVLLYWLICGEPIWGTNDDIVMSMIAAGFLVAANPSGDLLFVHFLLGDFISMLYQSSPQVAWYGLILCALIVLSLCVLCYSVLIKRRDKPFACSLTIGCWVVAFPLFWHLQFTVVSGVCAVAGFVFFLSLLTERERISHRGVLVTLGLLIASALLRFESFLMITALILPFAVWVMVCHRQKLADRRLMVAGFLLVIGLILIPVSHTSYYERSAEWQNWSKINELKSEYIDYRGVSFTAESAAKFDAAGMSATDFNMILSWQYVDPFHFSVEKLSVIEDAFRGRPLLGVDEMFRQVESGLIRFLPRFSAMLIVIGVLVIALLVRDAQSRIAAIILVVTLIVILGYLCGVLYRAPLRLWLTLGFGMFWCLLLIYAVGAKVSDSKARYVWSVAGLTVLGFFTLNLWHTQQFVQWRLSQAAAFHQDIQTWAINLPEGAVIYAMGSTFPYEHYLPLSPLDSPINVAGFIGGSFMNQSPVQREMVRMLGDETDFFLTLASRSHAYVVKRKIPRKRQFDILKQFYKERYGMRLALEEVEALPRLYRMKFKYTH